MNKKKLPKVIVCGIGEMRPTALPSTADAEQPMQIHCGTPVPRHRDRSTQVTLSR
jgi:hypothetical protein